MAYQDHIDIEAGNEDDIRIIYDEKLCIIIKTQILSLKLSGLHLILPVHETTFGFIGTFCHAMNVTFFIIVQNLYLRTFQLEN